MCPPVTGTRLETTEGTPTELGRFTVIAPPAGPGRRARAYTGEDSESFLVLQTLEKSLLEALSEAKATKGVPTLVPEARVGDKSSLTVLQYTFPAGQPFVKDFALLTDEEAEVDD